MAYIHVTITDSRRQRERERRRDDGQIATARRTTAPSPLSTRPPQPFSSPPPPPPPPGRAMRGSAHPPPPPPLRQKSEFSFPALTTVLRFACIVLDLEIPRQIGVFFVLQSVLFSSFPECLEDTNLFVSNRMVLAVSLLRIFFSSSVEFLDRAGTFFCVLR